MSVVHVEIDLAKNVFALHGVNEHGAVALRQPTTWRHLTAWGHVLQ